MSPPNKSYGTVRSLPPDYLGDDVDRTRRRRGTDITSRSRRSQIFDSGSPLTSRHGEYTEQDPFLPPHSRSSSPSEASTLTNQQPRRKLSTFWLLPVVFMAGFSRGMTMAPRIEVYTQIACDQIHPTVSPPSPLNSTASSLSFPLTLRDFHITSSSLMPHSTLPHTFLYTPHPSKMGVWGDKEVRASTPSKECLHDPKVQSRAAGIQATLGTIVGVLSIITAGYWGQISDAFGRKTVLSANLFGMTFHDVIYIMVSMPNTVFNRNAWGFLVLGPVVEGFLGGLTTLHAAEHAFLADCAQSGSRSTIFAYYQGASYIALASGPQISGLFLSGEDTDIRTIMFYSGLVFNFAVFLYALLILPESVTPEMMQAARHSPQPVIDSNNGEELKPKEKWARRIKEARNRLLAPVTIFAPKRKPEGGWDMNLTFLVIAQFTHLMSVGVYQLKLLYAQHTFAWGVKQLGYYVSLLWSLRAFHLLLLLPTIVHFIKPKRPVPPSGIIVDTPETITQDLKFDYRIAQFSIFIDTTAYVLTLIAPASSQLLFVSFTSLSSFTAGVNPAIQSLAVSYLVALNNDANVGQMFGGMSMLQAISHTLQPLLFGVVYSETVATYPKAIFALAAGLLISSAALFTLLRTNVTNRVDAEEAIEQHEVDERFGMGQVEDGDRDESEGEDDGEADSGDDEDGGDRGRGESSKPLLARYDEGASG